MTVTRPSTWIVRVKSACKFSLGRQPAAVGPPAMTLDSRYHAGCHVVEVMTVKRPSSWIVRVESDCQFALGRQPDGVAPRARKAPAIDGHNLEVVAVQVHGMAHHALIAQGQFDPLAGTDRDRPVLSPD